MLEFQRLRNPGQKMPADEAMQKFTGQFPHRQVVKRKPDPCGLRVDAITDSSGFLLNGIPTTKDPLPFDHLRGRMFAVLRSLFSGDNLGPQGKNFFGENRVVRLVTFISCLGIVAHTFNYSGDYRPPIHDAIDNISLCKEWALLVWNGDVARAIKRSFVYYEGVASSKISPQIAYPLDELGRRYHFHVVCRLE